MNGDPTATANLSAYTFIKAHFQLCAIKKPLNLNMFPFPIANAVIEKDKCDFFII